MSGTNMIAIVFWTGIAIIAYAQINTTAAGVVLVLSALVAAVIEA